MFTSPEVVLFCSDVDRAAGFYERLGFVEVFRTPPSGPAKHIDVVLDGFRLGLAGHDASREDHALETNQDPRRAAVILWCEDTPAAYRAVLEAGATPMAEPHRFLDDLYIAWAVDPDGHPIQVVTRLT